MKVRQAKMPENSRATRLTEAAAALASLYDALDKKDEAAKWRTERDGVKNAPSPSSKEVTGRVRPFSPRRPSPARPPRRSRNPGATAAGRRRRQASRGPAA